PPVPARQSINQPTDLPELPPTPARSAQSLPTNQAIESLELPPVPARQSINQAIDLPELPPIPARQSTNQQINSPELPPIPVRQAQLLPTNQPVDLPELTPPPSHQTQLLPTNLQTELTDSIEKLTHHSQLSATTTAPELIDQHRIQLQSNPVNSSVNHQQAIQQPQQPLSQNHLDHSTTLTPLSNETTQQAVATTDSNNLRLYESARPTIGTTPTIDSLRSTTPIPRIMVEVVAVTPTVVLQPLADLNQVMAQSWRDNQIRQLLPESRALLATLANWSHKLQEQSATAIHPTTNLASTRQALEEIVKQLPASQQLTDPKQLSAAMRNSGIWLEALLAQSTLYPEMAASFSTDLKAQLFRLADRIRHDIKTKALFQDYFRQTDHTASTQLDIALTKEQDATSLNPSDRALLNHFARDVDGMIKHVINMQLQSPVHNSEGTRWLLELPFQTNAGLQAIEADIRRDAQTQNNEEETWQMQLRLTLPILGPLAVNLNLSGGRLNASLVAEHAAGAALLRQNLSKLRQKLETHDIEIASLHAGEGQCTPPQSPIQHSLISDRA
ncbi:flagellar hook-length control protein FliK, partial [Thiospirillum jenense]